MLSVSFMDGYRKGIFTWNDKTASIPNLVKIRKDILYLEDITIERPTLYQKEVETDMKTVSLLRIPYNTPRNIVSKFMNANQEYLTQKADACPIYITRYRTLTEKFLSQVPYFDLFFLFCPEERQLLSAIFYIRKKYPQSMLFTEAAPEEIPVLLNAGIDLFNYTEENSGALQIFLETPTKEYVEKECHSTVRTKRLLRLLYREFYKENEKYTAFKKRKELYIADDSLYRPEVEQFRQKIRKRYTPPSNVFVLFPCSARKPYSTSKSHQLFKTAIPKNADITELILTSPLGVVPRELEDYVNYDIPVTGHWSHEEVKETARLLEHIIQKVKTPTIYAHLPGEYSKIVEDLPFTVINTVVDRPLSKKSLRNLSDHLHGLKKNPFLEQKMRAISEFLFNEDIFPEKITIWGRRTKTIKADTLLATYATDLLLTEAGANRLTNYYVSIDFELKGDVFCPGVMAADPEIRAGEQVVIKRVINGSDAVGIGRAVIPGFLMTAMNRGVAVKVKKRFHHAGEN
jgi:archaeosine synthase